MSKKIIFLWFLAFFIFPVTLLAEMVILKSDEQIEGNAQDTDGIDAVKPAAAAQDDKNAYENVELVDFIPAGIPITIKKPREWYIKEETDTPNNAKILYITKKELKGPLDISRYAITAFYFKDDQISKNMSWEEFTAFSGEAFGRSGYQNIEMFVNINTYSYPAFMLVGEKENIKLTQVSIKVGSDLLQVSLEAPLTEFNKYNPVFEEVLSSLTINKKP